jgi:hypothetical protein
MPPAPSGGKKKTGLILGAVAVVAAIGVGVYFVVGGSGGSGDAAGDDGPHKLTTPATVLTEYKKAEGNGSDSAMTKDDLQNAEDWGVKNPKDVSANYQAGEDESNPLAGKLVTFGGVYGEIEDPEKAVDGLLAYMKKDAEKEDVTMKGEPKAYTPAGFDGTVLKCQQATVKNTDATAGSGEPSEMNMTYCVWGDYSTIGFVMPMEIADIAAGKETDPTEAAALTAKFRKDVRVKI